MDHHLKWLHSLIWLIFRLMVNIEVIIYFIHPRSKYSFGLTSFFQYISQMMKAEWYCELYTILLIQTIFLYFDSLQSYLIWYSFRNFSRIYWRYRLFSHMLKQSQYFIILILKFHPQINLIHLQVLDWIQPTYQLIY